MRMHTDDVTSRLGVSRQTLQKWMAKGSFPRPQGRDGQGSWWATRVVDDWIIANMGDTAGEADDLAALPAAMAATVDEFAAALVGLPPEEAWARMFRMANRSVELLREANPEKSEDEIKNLVAIYGRCVRRRALQREAAEASQS